MEKLHGQDNTEAENKQNSNSEILSRQHIAGTPFQIVGNEEQGFAICFGKYRIGELRQSVEDAHKDLEADQWLIISRMCGLITELIIEEKKRGNDTN